MPRRRKPRGATPQDFSATHLLTQGVKPTPPPEEKHKIVMKRMEKHVRAIHEASVPKAEPRARPVETPGLTVPGHPDMRLKPFRPGDKPTGMVSTGRGLQPYWKAGPAGPEADPQTQLNAAERAKAERYRRKEIGTPGVVLRESMEMPALKALTEGAVHPAGLAVEAAGLLPFGRGARAAAKGAKTLSAESSLLDSATVEMSFSGAGAKEVAAKYGLHPKVLARHAQAHGERLTGRILSNKDVGAGAAKTKGSAEEILRRAEGRAPREVKLGERRQQFPESQSIITAKGQALFDRASERLAARATEMRESESSLAQGAGKALTPFSARARVPKMAGKLTRKESRRASSMRGQEAREIHRLKDDEQIAHFWYQQLPPEYRSGEGLSLLRDRQQAELTRYTSGEYSEELEKAMGAVRAAQREAYTSGDQDAVFEAMRDMEKLKAYQADVPARIKDLSDNVKDLARVAEKAPPAKVEALEAVDNLYSDREAILSDAGFKFESGDERQGLVSKYLGIEPTGEEGFIGHRAGRTRGARSTGLPGGVSTGRTRTPEGASQRNRLQLVKTGRARQSLETAIDDWQAAQVYHFHNLAKSNLAEMGEPVSVLGPKPDHLVINPKGHTLPRRWKQDEAAVQDDDGALIDDVTEYISNYIAEGPDAQRLIEQAAKAGHLDDLRQVPKDVVARYYGQFLNPKVFQSAVPVAQEKYNLPRLAGKGLDTLNNALYTSLIYSNPGYIPANSAANLIMAGLHQGAFLPVNLSRSGQVLTRAPKQLRDLIKAEVGHGPSIAASSEKAPLSGIARVVSGIADDPYRISAFIHEAAREGVIPKVRATLSQKDYDALHNLLTNPKKRALLNDISDRAIQSMVDFERMGPWERTLARRILFVWAWIRGATRYPGRFALDHPARTMFLIYGAAGAPGAPVDIEPLPHYMAKNMPPWLENAIKMGEVTVNGKSYEQLLPTRAISPLSTPAEVIGTAISRPGAQTFAEMLNPGIAAAFHTLSKQDPYGGEVGSYAEAGEKSLERLVPQKKLAEDLANPPAPEEAGLYPEDTSRVGRLKRASRVFPIAIDPEEAYQSRKRLGMGGSREEAAIHDFTHDSKQVGMGYPPDDVVEDLKRKTSLDHEINKVKDDDPHKWTKRAELMAKHFDEWFDSDVSRLLPTLKTEGESERMYDLMRDRTRHAWWRYYAWQDRIDKLQDAKLAGTPTG